MELKVFWTEYAVEKLEAIFKYYEKKAGTSVAAKMIERIVSTAEKLERNPRVGQKEVLLKSRKKEFRYLIVKSYKIIYWIDDQNQKIEIVLIFDTRQNPINLSNSPI